MRRVMWALAVAAAATVLWAAVPATAQQPGAGAVQGVFYSYETRFTSCRLQVALSFAGALPVGASSYDGVFTVSGNIPCDWQFSACLNPPCLPQPDLPPTPRPFTGTLAVAGSISSGDTIAGTCGEPGSSADLVQIVLVCTTALNGGEPAHVTLTSTIVNIPNPISGPSVAGVFTA